MLSFSNIQLSGPIVTLWWLSLALPAAADTFLLKDGSKLDGVILREDATTYTLEVKITKSIKDERTVAKTQVVKIERADSGQIAFDALRQWSPAPDALPREEYTPRIHAVEKFLHDYPASSHVPDAKAILATLVSESDAIAGGAVKLNGMIVPATEYQANRYELDAKVQKVRIQQLVRAGDTLQALRAFSAMDQEFRNTTAYAEVVPLIQQVITSYVEEVDQLLGGLDARIKERSLGLERMTAMDRRSTELAIQQEFAELDARFKLESAAKSGWVTMHPFFKPSLDATLVFAKQELARLTSIKNPPTVDGGKAFRDALALIQGHGDPTQVAAAIAAAATAMVPPRYLAMLESSSGTKAAR